MSPDDLNYRHLRYFWAVAKEGSITRAADRLGVSVQTISTQLGQLERQLGQALLAPQGRSLALTDAGRTALAHAEQIFQIGDKLRQALADREAIRPRLAVGVTEAVPKLVSFHLLEAVMRPPLSVRLECQEGAFEHLLGELALNRLDLLIADRSAPQRANFKFESQRLGEVDVALFGVPPLNEAFGVDFPQRLNGAPVLLPMRGDALRSAIDAWFDANALRPLVVGEFSDSALLKTFGRAGSGLFPAPVSMQADIAAQYGAYPLGVLPGVREGWYAITIPRRVQHPAVKQIQATQLSAQINGEATDPDPSGDTVGK